MSRLSSSSSGTSTALFGCICAHDPVAGMQIQCSVLPYGGLLASETGQVPVFFQQGSTVQASLHCSEVDIIVQSVRWPATRFSSPSAGGAYTSSGSVDCVTSRTCNKVDATIWVIPRTSCDSESAVCDCFPYCMASRLSGSQTAPVIFYSASQWKSKVFLIERDCNLHTVSSEFVSGVSKAVTYDGVTTVQASGSGGGLQFVGGSQQTISCIDNLLVTTLVNRSLHPSYDTPTPVFLRNPYAPFVITGDTVLTSVHHGDGGYTVRVERLTGAANHEFTLSVVSNNFPAAPPLCAFSTLSAVSQGPPHHSILSSWYCCGELARLCFLCSQSCYRSIRRVSSLLPKKWRPYRSIWFNHGVKLQPHPRVARRCVSTLQRAGVWSQPGEAGGYSRSVFRRDSSRD